MPRPAEFTADMQAAADAEMDRASRDPVILETIPQSAFSTPFFREAWYIGAWLTAKLAKRGIPMPIIRKLCYQNGRLLFGEIDPWSFTITRLAAIYASADRMKKEHPCPESS